MHFANEPKKQCPICKTASYFQIDGSATTIFWACPVCGRYELNIDMSRSNMNHLASFLFYNGYEDNDFEYRYYTGLEKELCDQYRKDFNEGHNIHGLPVHMDREIVDRWYPSSFSEKTDFIIRYIGEHTRHAGQPVILQYQQALSLLFIDRIEYSDTANPAERDRDDCTHEIKFMLDCLKNDSFIEYAYGSTEEKMCQIVLQPKGFNRLDEIQRSKAKGNNALVAMQFGDETRKLRECIRQGITDAGYNAIFIDEVEHNDFITPEIMKYIKDSKFVVADLTHQNNGAYFEEGFAMGLGKPVIQLCKNGVKLHFDIAQKNTIMWEKEEEIPLRLMNRIKATIE